MRWISLKTLIASLLFAIMVYAATFAKAIDHTSDIFSFSETGELHVKLEGKTSNNNQWYLRELQKQDIDSHIDILTANSIQQKLNYSKSGNAEAIRERRLKSLKYFKEGKVIGIHSVFNHSDDLVMVVGIGGGKKRRPGYAELALTMNPKITDDSYRLSVCKTILDKWSNEVQRLGFQDFGGKKLEHIYTFLNFNNHKDRTLFEQCGFYNDDQDAIDLRSEANFYNETYDTLESAIIGKLQHKIVDNMRYKIVGPKGVEHVIQYNSKWNNFKLCYAHKV